MWMSAKALHTFIFAMTLLLLGTPAYAQELKLSDLVEEALKNSPEILIKITRAGKTQSVKLNVDVS